MGDEFNGILAVDRPNRSLDLLWPVFRGLVAALLVEAKATGLSVDVFEAWRSPQRQAWLYASGRSRPGKLVTKADAWGSWHQFGLAADLVFKDPAGGWTWVGDYKMLGVMAKRRGLHWLGAVDQPHFQLTGGMTLPVAQGLQKNAGTQAVWLAVEQLIKKGPAA